MASTSPGDTSSTFVQLLPGAPNTSLQTLTCFSFRHKSYVAYISGDRLCILSGPYVLVQSLAFDEQLVGVSAEAQTCKIVVAGKKEIWTLEPVTEGWTKVWWEKTLSLQRDDSGDEAQWVSWGIEGEILVGGNRKLSLFSTLPSSRTSAAAVSPTSAEQIEERRTLWAIGVPSALQHAVFSHSAALIATCGYHDRFVKIWRRLSFEEGLFDYFYLPHPSIVTHLQWRPIDEHSEGDTESGTSGKQDDEPEALYTIASDGILRVWKTSGPHDLEMLVLHATINLVSGVSGLGDFSVKHQCSPSTESSNRYTCILHSDHFYAAVNARVGGMRKSLERRSSQHLVDVSSRQPDIVISFDGHGRMSAWGLQSIGHKRRPETPTEPVKPPYHITHAEDLPMRIPDGVNARFAAWFEGGILNLVGHRFDGEVRWWQGDIESFFAPPDTSAERLSELAYWAGHSNGSIDSLRASAVGRGLVSCDTSGRAIHWKSTTEGILHQSSSYTIQDGVLDVASISHGQPPRPYTVTLELETSQPPQSSTDFVLRDAAGHELSRSPNNELGHDHNALTWQIFATKTQDDLHWRIIALSSAGRGFGCLVNTEQTTFEHSVHFDVPKSIQDDPLKHLTAVSDANDLSRLGVISVTNSGSLLFYHLQPWEVTGWENLSLVGVFASGCVDASVFTANNDFAAIATANRRELTIINLIDGWVEYNHHASDEIQQVVAAQHNSLLAIGYRSTIDILSQGRIGYREEMPPWLPIKQIRLGEVGLSLNALAWLLDGGLAVAAESSIFVSSGELQADQLAADVREATRATTADENALNIHAVAEQLKGPIPVWHPTFIAHIVRHGSWSLASSLVNRLLQKLKFWTEGDVLQPMLNIPPAQLYGAESLHDQRPLDRETVTDLEQQLDEKDMPLISGAEQDRLKCVLETMVYCSEHVAGLDNSALRFLFSWKLELLLMNIQHIEHNAQVNGITDKERSTVPEMHWREVALAFHSSTQQPLLDILLAHYENKWTWDIARRLGVFAWLSDRDALAQIFEALAQSTYRSTSPPDPINASLYFLALNKKQTLLGLWRIATWHKEQRATINFLKRDFGQSGNQTAAKKNAYALMGKRRFEYAASFFLLSGDGPSATNVLASQCSDVMLAIAVGRLEGGDTSPALRRLIENRLIPEGKRQGDRWLLSWCYSLLQETEAAASALIEPMGGVRYWLQDDPSTLTLYKQLRRSSSELEFDAVLRAARILRRMGLWLIALELVSQWEFRLPEAPTSSIRPAQDVPVSELRENAEAPSLLDAFAEPGVDNEKAEPTTNGEREAMVPPSEKETREAKATELLKQIKSKKEQAATAAPNEKSREPTQFQEPDSNSLLDNFGF